MKILIFIFSLLIFACKNPNRKKLTEIQTHSVTAPIKNNETDIAGIDRSDTVIISLEGHDTLRYTQQELDMVEKYIFGLSNGFVTGPDMCYPKEEIIEFKDSLGYLKTISFSSEVGKDAFYELYAYFLKSKNGEKKFAARRNTTIEIFRDLNEIYDAFVHGGTYFGHQYNRILGYAEYSIYKYACGNYDKSYNISIQKKLYINSLRQLITDEISGDNHNGLSAEDKSQAQGSLLKIVNKIEKLISDYFYLKSAQEFQYPNY